MLRFRSFLGFSVAFLMSLEFASPGVAFANPRDPLERRERCPHEGEDTEFLRARLQWFVETYGENGIFNPEKRLLHVRDTYAQYRREVARKKVASRKSQADPNTPAFRFLGPTNGAGRATSVETHPLDSRIVYVGAAGGGLWKSTDGGLGWRALTDGLADLSVGAVAVSRSSPSVVYLGTGEGGYAGDFIPGIGILRSTDGGETWRLPESVAAPLVYRLSVDPRNAETVLAFTNNGVLLSTDGALSWTRTSDPAWGDATDAVRSLRDPDLIDAVFWVPFAASTESSRYARSTDGGRTFRERRTGLPEDPKGRMALGVSTDSRTIYTLVSGTRADGTQLGLFVSTNGGDTFRKTELYDPEFDEHPSVLGGQGWYGNAVSVDPDDARTLVLGGIEHYRSTDGGETVQWVGSDIHVDVHQLSHRKYPLEKLLWSANDGGIYVSTDGGRQWLDRNTGLATRQYYSVALDPMRPDILYAGTQDNGTDTRRNATTTFQPATGGDGFEAALNADNPTIVYTSSQFTTLFRSIKDGAPGSFRYIAQPFAGAAYARTGDGGPRPFYTWLTLEPGNPRILYTGTHRVWRSEDAGETWSPLESSNFVMAETTRALAIAPTKKDRLLAAQTGRLLLSNDRGATFSRIFAQLPTTNVIRNVEIDPNDPDTFFVCTASSATAFPGRLFKSTDAGATWIRREAGLPDFGLETVRVDPSDSRLVYAGTLVGLYRSTNGGVTWERWGEGLPAVAIHEVRLAADGSRITVATHGRGIWSAEMPNVNRAPVVMIDAPAESAVTIPAGGSVLFEGTALDPDGDPLKPRWSLGDGRFLSGTAPGRAAFARPGVYPISFFAEDSKGARGGAFRTVVAKPSNDTCEEALVIPLVPGVTVLYRGGNAGTTRFDSQDPATCSPRGIAHSIWFTLTVPSAGTLELDTLGSTGNTVLSLYDGTCAQRNMYLDCNDDLPEAPGGPSKLASRRVQAGQRFRLLVASWGDPLRARGDPVDALRVRALFRPDEGPVAPFAALPFVVDAYGRGGARFTSDLVLLNRGEEPLVLALSYGGEVEGNVFTTALAVPPKTQIRAEDALDELRRGGLSIPRSTPTSPQIGPLRIFVASGDPGSLKVVSRSSSPNTTVGGAYGLFAVASPYSQAADAEAVYVYGLRQDARDRSNLALVHVGMQGEIELKVELFSADGMPAPNPLTAVLQPGGLRQFNEVLRMAGIAEAGYARIQRTRGIGRFVAYGVLNDQKTADGSFIAMVRSGAARASQTLLVPVVVEAKGVGNSFFTSELVLANRSRKSGTARLQYFASPQYSGLGSGALEVALAASAQRVIPDLIGFLRGAGLAIPTTNAQAGSLKVTFLGFDAEDDVYAGVRTSTPNPDQAEGGSFGVFMPAPMPEALAASSVTIPALRQDSSMRSNLAVVNAGDSAITVEVQLFSADGGRPLGSPLSKEIAPGELYQWSAVFSKAGVGDAEGYAVVKRVLGDAPWHAYGVLNDNRTSDGSVIAGTP